MINSIRVAVVGTGYWGKNLIRNFHELEVLHAVCDFNVQVAESYASQYQVSNLSWTDILNDETICAVALAVPAAMHAQFVREALLANKHVFVEKPIALNIDDAKELATLAQRQARTLMVGHLLQYHPAYIKLKELVDNSILGNLRYVYSNRLSLGKIRSEEDVWWSFAPHDLSMILGLVKQQPTSSLISENCYINKNIADVFTVHLTFPEGISAHVFVSWMHPVKEQKLVVIGDKAMAVFDDMKPWDEKLIIYHHELQTTKTVPEYKKHDGENISLTPAEPLKAELQHFIDCIKNNVQPRTDGYEAIRVLEVLQAASNQSDLNQHASNNVFVHHTAEVDAKVSIGSGTKIWHFSHILSNSTIGKNTVIGQNVMLGPEVIVGDNCKIQNNVSLYKGVKLGKGVFCGPSCVFTNVNNPRAEIERKEEFRLTDVEDGVTIGANATIICGVKLGQYSFIGAGAVVTKDVPAFALMVGNPARQLGWVSHAGERLGTDLICPREGRMYKLDQNKNQLDEITHEHSS